MKHTVKKFITLLLALSMMLGMLPALSLQGEAASNFEGTFEGQEADVFSALGFDTSVIPEGYDEETTENPYGKDKLPGNQVFELLNTSANGTKVYGKNDNTVSASSIKGEPGNGAEVPLDMFAVAAGDFDGDGLAGEAVYVGFLDSEIGYGDYTVATPLYMVIYNAKDATFSGLKKIGTTNPALVVTDKGNQYAKFDYAWQNMLQVTAGDYDGDGTMEIAAYVGENGNSRVDIFKYQKTSESGEKDWLKEGSWERVWSHTLSNTKNQIPNMVSLVSGDFNRDGVDDLGISCGRFAPFGESTVTMDKSTAMILWGGKSKMLQSSSPVDLDEAKLGEQTRVSLIKGDLDKDGYPELIATGHPTADLFDYTTDYSVAETWETNTERSIITYLYDADAGLIITYSGVQQIVSGSMNTQQVNDETKEIWQSGNGFDERSYSQPLMRTNAAAFNAEGADYAYLYLDSHLFEYTEGALTLKASLNEPGNVYNGSDTLIATGTNYNCHWGTQWYTLNATSTYFRERASYAEYGAVSGDINGDGYQILATSFYRHDSQRTKTGTASHQTSFGVLSGTSGGKLSITMTMDDATYAAPHQSTRNSIVPAMVDVDYDTVLIEYTGIHKLSYSDPEVLAVIAAAPYFEDVDRVYGYDYAWQNTTSFSKTSGKGDGDLVSVRFDAGAFLDSTLTAGGGAASFGMSIMGTLDWEKETTTTTEYTVTYQTSQDEDAVAFYCIPTESYVYNIYTPNGSGGYNVEQDVISRTFSPCVQVLTLDYYESIRKDYTMLPEIKGKVLTSTPGDPSSYPTSSAGYDVIAEWNDTPAGVSFGNGSITQEITITEETTTSKQSGANIDWKLGGGVHVQSDLVQSDVSVIAGAQWSLNPASGTVDINLTGTTISGTVTNMPLEFRDYGYYYTWKLFSYNMELPDKTKVPVVSYIVSDVSQPPTLPTDFQQDYDRSTSESNVLTWTYDGSFSKFYIYRYFDFPVGGGLQLVKEVPSDTADYTVKYDENGKPYKEYFFEDTNLAAYTEYEYAIQVERLSEIPPLSSPSEIVVARTKAAKGNPVMTIVESDKENDGKLLVYPDKTATVTMAVTGPEGESPDSYYTTVQYQWQIKERGAWVDVVNETADTLTFAAAGADVAGEYRCRVNVLTKSDNTAITAYSDSFELTHSYRSSYIKEFYVNDVSGGGVELFVKVANGHADSASVPVGQVTFNVTENATGKSYQYVAKLNTAGVINVIIEDSLPEGMYTATVSYSGSTIFKPCEAETLYLSQRSSGYDIDVPDYLTYGEGGDITFRNVSKADGVTTSQEAPAAYYNLLKGEKLTAVSIPNATQISSGATVTAGKPYYLLIEEAKYYFTASHSGKATVDDLYVTIGEANEYITYLGAGGTYVIAENIPAGGYVIKMTGDDGSLVYNNFTVDPRPITLQLPIQQSGEGTSAGDESTDAPSVKMGELTLLAGSYASCDMTDGVLNSDIGSKPIYIDYINNAGTVYSRWAVDAQCGYYIMRAQEANRVNFPNYNITFIDGAITILGATREVKLGVRPFEEQQVGSLYILSPEYGVTRAQMEDANALAVNHPTGTRLVFSAVPDEGYEIYDWYINGIAQSCKDSSLAYVLLAEDTTIEVQFAVKQNALIFGTEGDEGGGTIVCSDPDITSDSSVLANAHLFFYAKANEGYHFKEWRYTERGKGTVYDDTDYGAMDSTFELLMPRASCSVLAVFERDFYEFSFEDRSGNGGMAAWYLGSATGDITAETERIYIQSGDKVKGDTQIFVGPKPGWAVTENQAYVSTGSQGQLGTDGIYTLILTQDTHVSGHVYQKAFDLTMSYSYSIHDVYPSGTVVNYTIGEEMDSFPWVRGSTIRTISQIDGGTKIEAVIEVPDYYMLMGWNLDSDPSVEGTKTPVPRAIRAELWDYVTKGQTYFVDVVTAYSLAGEPVINTYYITPDRDGLLAHSFGHYFEIWQPGNTVTIDALERDEKINIFVKEKPSYKVTMSDISGKGTYSLELPDGAYETALADGKTQVTVHEGDNFTVLVTPEQKWTVSYWRTTPESGETVQVRASSLKYTIPAITENFEFTPIFSSTTYNTILWTDISEKTNGLTLSPMSGYISSVSAGNDFKFKLSGVTLGMIEQVFANGQPFVPEGETSDNLTYSGSGADRVYTISNIQENMTITVTMKDIGVTVNGVDIINLMGTGWTYSPKDQVLEITRSNLVISGKSIYYAPELTINFGPEAVSVVFDSLNLDPASGTSETRTAINSYAEKLTVTVNASDNFVEGAMVGKEIVFRGNGAITFENVGNAALQADAVTLLGTVKVTLTKSSKGNANNNADIGVLNMGVEGSKSAAPTLLADATVLAGTVNTYAGELIVKSSGYALRIASLNSYGGVLDLTSGSSKQVVYVDNGGTGWRAYAGGYVANYSKGSGDPQYEAKTSQEYSNGSYHLICGYGESSINANTYLRFNLMSGGGSLKMTVVTEEGWSFAADITQYNGSEALYYFYDGYRSQINSTTASGAQEWYDNHPSAKPITEWRIVAKQDSAGMWLQGHKFVSDGNGGYTAEEENEHTYEFTFSGVSPLRISDNGDRVGMGIDTAPLTTVKKITFENFTGMEMILKVRTERPVYFIGENYLQKQGESPLQTVHDIYDLDILDIRGDGSSNLTISSNASPIVNNHYLRMGSINSFNIINTAGERALEVHGSMSGWGATIRWFDYNTENESSLYTDSSAEMSYGIGWRQAIGNSAATLQELDSYNNLPGEYSYVKFYGLSTEGGISPNPLVYDRDEPEDTSAMAGVEMATALSVTPPVVLGNIHLPVSITVTDSEGNAQQLSFMSWDDLINSSGDAQPTGFDVFHYGSWVSNYSFYLQMESGSVLSSLADGTYTLRMDFYDEDKSDNTYYYYEMPLIITHGEVSEEHMSISPMTATLGRGESVTFTAAYEGRVPSRYIWYVNDVEIQGETAKTLSYTVPEDAELHGTLSIRCEAYEGDTKLGYAGAAITVSPSAESLVIEATGRELQEDGSYLLSHMPNGLEQEFTALVTLNDGTTDTLVEWTLWGNTLNSTKIDAKGVLTIDPAETGTNNQLVVRATYKNPDGTIYVGRRIINLSTDAYIVYNDEDGTYGRFLGVTADGEALAAGGAFAPAGSEIVVTAAPAEGRQVTQWYVNGEPVEAGEVYAIDNRAYTLRFTAEPMGQYIVTAFFGEKSHVIVEYAAGENGSLTAMANESAVVSGGLVSIGSDVVFTALPDALYAVSAWYVNGELAEGELAATLTLSGVTSDRYVTVEFAPMERTLQTVVEFGGSVQVTNSAGQTLSGENGLYTVPATQMLTLTAVASEGFVFQGWAIDEIANIVQVEDPILVLEPEAEDVTVWAIFEAVDHNHEYSFQTVDPTCTDLGYTLYTCRCGHSYKADYVAATGHSYEETVIAPTCTTMGYTLQTCHCGHTEKTDYVAATGHSYEETVVQPTCTTMGYTVFTCACGVSYTDRYIDPMGHTYTAELTAPTCTELGFTTYTCACGHSYQSDYVAKTEHEYSTEITEPTCTELGYTTYICSCGDSYQSDYVEVIPHDYSAQVTAPTCGSLGYTLYTCSCGASYKSDYVATAAHSYTAQVVAPTCASMGYTVYSCSCGHSYWADFIEPTGHSYTARVIAPTCTAGGYTLYTCSCGHSYLSQPVEALGHSYTAHVTEPTHNAMGYTTHTCSCGSSYIDSFTPSPEHEYEMSVTKEATCTSEGEMSFSCACGSAYTLPIPKTEHSYEERLTAPTCQSMGYSTFTCACGHSYKTNYTDPVAHSLETQVVEPNCLYGGYTKESCSSCGYCVVTDVTQPTGQHETVLVGQKDATYVEDGYTGDLMCKHCGAVVEVGRAIPMLMKVEVKFNDVDEDAWYADAVEYVVSRGLMTGVGENNFAPETETTRAMMVTLLYRLAGSPDVTGLSNPFTDVKEGQWYYEPILWAYDQGIVNGISQTLYAPEQTVTREQLVAMLYRYAGQPEADQGVLEQFPDEAKVSDYARDAMSWAIARGLIAGIQKNGKVYLMPGDTATRAQIATIFMRYCET